MLREKSQQVGVGERKKRVSHPVAHIVSCTISISLLQCLIEQYNLRVIVVTGEYSLFLLSFRNVYQ